MSRTALFGMLLFTALMLVGAVRSFRRGDGEHAALMAAIVLCAWTAIWLGQP